MNWRRTSSSVPTRSMARSNMTVNLDNSMSADEIQSRINLLPRHIPYGKTLTIQFANGRYVMTRRLDVTGFYGGGTLSFQGNPNEPSALYTGHGVELDFVYAPEGYPQCLQFFENDCLVSISHLMIQPNMSTNNCYAITLGASKGMCNFYYNRMLSRTSGTGYLLVATRCKASIINSYFDYGYAAVTATENAIVYCQDNDDSIALTTLLYTYISAGATLIGTTGTYPNSANGSAYPNGGQIA